MHKLPLLISVPHAGLIVPHEVEEVCILSHEDIVIDGDEGAAVIYAISEHVESYHSSPIARAIVDLNRAEDDFRQDGVIKTHTIWGARVYSRFPDERMIKLLLKKYYHPYHRQLTEAAGGKVKMGIDCHTMAARGATLADDKDVERPLISISDNEGKSLPLAWREAFVYCLEKAFGLPVAINHPFQGGHITATHSKELAWIQLEFSRTSFYPLEEKRERLLQALYGFCESGVI